MLDTILLVFVYYCVYEWITAKDDGVVCKKQEKGLLLTDYGEVVFAQTLKKFGAYDEYNEMALVYGIVKDPNEYDRGIFIYDGKLIGIPRKEMIIITKLKDRIGKENPSCVIKPRSSVFYFYVYDTDLTYTIPIYNELETCAPNTMVSYYKLRKIIDNLTTMC